MITIIKYNTIRKTILGSQESSLELSHCIKCLLALETLLRGRNTFGIRAFSVAGPTV